MVHIRARMSVLLHICCAPCSISCIEILREEGMEPTGFWFNPNIHPYKEYQARKDTLVEYAAKIGLKLIMRDEYGLRPFIRAIYPSLENRCGTCYRIRFEETARFAAENGFDGFSSTLFVSPYQNHELLRKTAEKRQRNLEPVSFTVISAPVSEKVSKRPGNSGCTCRSIADASSAKRNVT